MSSIYIYSPSGAVRDKVALRRGIKRLQELGHEIQVDPSALKSFERFAGSDEERLASIERATTSGADIAMITRGGYGLSRLLPKMPYKKIAKAIHSGTTFVGLSDFTAFQMAVLAMTGQSTWAGPALISDFGSEEEPKEILNWWMIQAEQPFMVQRSRFRRRMQSVAPGRCLQSKSISNFHSDSILNTRQPMALANNQ